MKIRIANIDDAQVIADLHTDSWRNTYQNTLSEHYLNDIAPGERLEIWRNRLKNPKSNQVVRQKMLVLFIAFLHLMQKQVPFLSG